MGSVTYNFLSQSFLLNISCIQNQYREYSENEIFAELEGYRNHVIKHFDELIEEIKHTSSSLKVFSTIQKTELTDLSQMALYLDQFIINDPLFPETGTKDNSTKVMSDYLGYSNEKINRKQISLICKYLKDITPMVAGNYVKIFPVSYYFETPKEKPITIPIDYYNGILPPPILDYFRKHIYVSSMTKSKVGWEVNDNLELSRGLVVEFPTRGRYSNIYHLFETTLSDFDENSGEATIRHVLPDTPPEQNMFDAWVNQSINQTSGGYFKRILTETILTSSLNATYLSYDNFTSDLISLNFETSESIQSNTATELLNIDLPFLDQIDIQKLMDIRDFDADTFTNFRLELERNFRDLRSITDPQELKIRKENIIHELNDVQTTKIDMKMRDLSKQVAINSTLLLGGLAGSIQTSGFSLLASGLAIGKGIKDYHEYKKKVKDNPSYLLWRVKKK